jgi:hypothetical protein
MKLSELISSIENYEKFSVKDVRYLAYADFKKTLINKLVFKLVLQLLRFIAINKSKNTYKVQRIIDITLVNK